MSQHAQELIAQHLDLWSSAITAKKTTGRGSSKKIELYGVKKLRELILELAVRGKLVPQDPNDEPASELLKRIAKEKAQLVADKKIKKPKKLPEITVDEKPFNLPEGWAWARLEDLAPMSLFDGDWIESKDQDPNGKVRLVQLADVGVGVFKNVSSKFINRETLTRLNCTTLQQGDVLIARLPSPIGRACIFPNLKEEAITAVDVAILRLMDFTVAPYVMNVANSLTFRSQVESYGKGATRFRISTGNLKTILVPVCSKLEQHRIVAKVDELMALCDQLEKQTEQSLDAHATLADTLLDALTQAQSHTELMDNWQRLEQNWDILFPSTIAGLRAIDKLKQTILQLAVMGKLVPPASRKAKESQHDEPASELLKRIAAEKAQLVKDKKIKKQKPLPPVTEDEKPFELPDGWCTVRFADLCQEVATGPFGSMISKSEYVNGGVPLINPSHMIEGKVVEDPQVSVSHIKAKELASYKVYENDVVMARRGEMGRCAVISDRESEWLCGTGSFVLRFNAEVSRPYILLLFKTRYAVEYLGGQSIGTTMTNLNHGILNRMPVPLPPLEAQKRIVAKVEELTSLCDQLKQRLQTAQQTQRHFTDAVVARAIS
ncbi:restriction endonuclease subunit S [Gilvimarinus algae]|uniref:Restriction endonuclease subunit S n=1 Tax=Gilvimarinus algae TaxID=3058037 RepID=A0ABT8THY1_9GAMM|nr:restriction endonuclease subunit S [Gilvimarinus sp. SDUM040014]MDO3383688.1 restriction endonuclease subunit S [Gilvimarinus sp. SDUM040014]